jgi:hypothetical protein
VTNEPDDLEDLLSSVADGSPVDWDAAAGRVAQPRARNRIDDLRRIARISSFHKERLPDGGPRPATERWGDLLLLERLGAGAHADVYRAWDPSLEREVALKLLRAGTEVGPGPSPLITEGRAAARARHPNVVTMYGVASHSGRVGLWMELVRGPTLEQAVGARGALPVAEAVRLGREIGSALAAVHELGMVHRDVKPANIMLDAQGRFVLSDFGLGRRWSADRAESIGGTPMYMAPECLDGAPASQRSDVHSLGLVLWFALAGRHPHSAATVEELRAAPRPPVSLGSLRTDVTPAVESALERALATRPEARPTAREFAALLEHAESPARSGVARTGAGAPAAPHWAWIAAIALIVSAGAVAFALWRERSDRPASGTLAGPPVTAPAADDYDVEAWFERRGEDTLERLAAGDRVRPGDRLSMQIRSTRAAWVYVLNEDDHGERFLLFPHPVFDRSNPLPADSTFTLPGTAAGEEIAWGVTSRGGHERFLVVASPEPVAELEAGLDQIPVAVLDGTIRYAPVPDRAVERLRGTGSIVRAAPRRAETASAFDHFRTLADREVGVQGIWVRQTVLENP